MAQFCKRIGLAHVINAAVPTQMTVDVGTVVQLMMLDTLSGRSPLYRLERFARSVDTGLLLGKNIPAVAFNDTTLGRAMDAIYILRWRSTSNQDNNPRNTVTYQRTYAGMS